MKNTTTLLLVAAGALLVGGVATAAFMKGDSKAPTSAIQTPPPSPPEMPLPTQEAVPTNAIQANQPPSLQYAEVLTVKPVTTREKRYATVIGTEPVRETTTTTTPHEVCEDVVVQERLPERDGNTGGTVAGAVIGGLLGNQIGKGDGRKAATVVGAVAGGVIGNQADKRHVGGRVVERTERQCHTETASSESSRVTGYNVTYRNPDGTTGTMRMGNKPGTRIPMGTDEKLVGYDVTYRLDGQENTVRMEQKPEQDRLPVIDGKVVLQTASASRPDKG